MRTLKLQCWGEHLEIIRVFGRSKTSAFGVGIDIVAFSSRCPIAIAIPIPPRAFSAASSGSAHGIKICLKKR